jgi:HK97 family phage prohead protease
LSVAVATEPAVLAMRLVPFGPPQLVADYIDGRSVIYFEQFDAQSFGSTPARLPLLRAHSSASPIGWVETMHLRADGLDGEARLVGSSAEIANLRALIADDLLAGVSIGFAPDSARDQWSKGGRNDRPPTVLRRGARLREVSLCLEAAYPAAKVTEIRSYTVAEAERREQHRQRDEEFRQCKLERRAEADAFRADLESFVAQAEARGRELAGMVRTPAAAPVGAIRRVILDDDVIGVAPRSGAGRWVTWGEATAEVRGLYLRTGSIWPAYV